jgi:hypothetical protein
MKRMMCMTALLATVGACGAPGMDLDASDEEVRASYAAADVARSAGVDHYQVTAMSRSRANVYLVDARGVRLASLSTQRTSTGLNAQIAGLASSASKTPPPRFSLGLSATLGNTTARLVRTLSDGARTLTLDVTADKRTRKIVSGTLRFGARTLALSASTTSTAIRGFINQSGAWGLVQQPLVGMLVAAAKDRGLWGQGGVAVEIDWGAGVGCAVDVAQGAAGGGFFGAVLGGLFSSDCWDFVSSWWD